jgi:N-methylhydantoinase B
LRDVLERWETLERANEVYGVVFSGHIEDESLAVDVMATQQQRGTIGAA